MVDDERVHRAAAGERDRLELRAAARDAVRVDRRRRADRAAVDAAAAEQAEHLVGAAHEHRALGRHAHRDRLARRRRAGRAPAAPRRTTPGRPPVERVPATGAAPGTGASTSTSDAGGASAAVADDRDRARRASSAPIAPSSAAAAPVSPTAAYDRGRRGRAGAEPAWRPPRRGGRRGRGATTRARRATASVLGDLATIGQEDLFAEQPAVVEVAVVVLAVAAVAVEERPAAGDPCAERRRAALARASTTAAAPAPHACLEAGAEPGPAARRTRPRARLRAEPARDRVGRRGERLDARRAASRRASAPPTCGRRPSAAARNAWLGPSANGGRLVPHTDASTASALDARRRRAPRVAASQARVSVSSSARAHGGLAASAAPPGGADVGGGGAGAAVPPRPRRALGWSCATPSHRVAAVGSRIVAPHLGYAAAFRRRSRVVQARACKAPYTGSIPVAASLVEFARAMDGDTSRALAWYEDSGVHARRHTIPRHRVRLLRLDGRSVLPHEAERAGRAVRRAHRTAAASEDRRARNLPRREHRVPRTPHRRNRVAPCRDRSQARARSRRWTSSSSDSVTAIASGRTTALTKPIRRRSPTCAPKSSAARPSIWSSTPRRTSSISPARPSTCCSPAAFRRVLRDRGLGVGSSRSRPTGRASCSHRSCSSCCAHCRTTKG